MTDEDKLKEIEHLVGAIPMLKKSRDKFSWLIAKVRELQKENPELKEMKEKLSNLGELMRDHGCECEECHPVFKKYWPNIFVC